MRANAQIYLAVLLGAILLTIGAVAGYAWHRGPPVGDLVRLSGAPLRAFAWSTPAKGFVENHYRRIDQEALLAGADPGGLLVFGDSFSAPREDGTSWINWVVSGTGLETRFVRIKSLEPVLAYLESEAYRAAPPSLIIVETIARALYSRALKVYRPEAGCPMPPWPRSVAGSTVVNAPMRKITLRRHFLSLNELLSWGALSARKQIFGAPAVRKFTLERSDLFSNEASDRLLVVATDLRNRAVHERFRVAPQEVAERTGCALRQIAAAAEGRLILTIAPDKLSVYEPYIVSDLPPKPIDAFGIAKAALGPVFIDLMRPLSTAVADGSKDVYWPNDTHWGATGNRIVGKTVLERIIKSDAHANQ